MTGIGREKKNTGGGGGEGGWVQPERFELLIPQQKKMQALILNVILVSRLCLVSSGIYGLSVGGM